MSARRPVSTLNASYDQDSECFIDWDPMPYAEGAFRYVRKGYSTGGKRYVSKHFKPGGVLASARYEGSYYANERKVHDKASDIVALWNKQLAPTRTEYHLGHAFTVRMDVTLCMPKLGRFGVEDNAASANGTAGASGAATLREGQMFATSPWIDNWEKFNSNTGWTLLHQQQQGARDDPLLPNVPTTEWHEMLQALSHFSYHVTKGRLLLCDLQGAVFFDGVVLADPAVLSADGRGTYGVKDLGMEGIASFFYRHRCNKHCAPDWRKPRARRAHLQASRRTTFILPSV